MDFVFKRSYRGPLKAVIFDWAGTTVDYGCYAPAFVFIDVFKRKGVPITMAEARAPMGAHKRVHIREISRMERVAECWQAIHGRLPNEEDIEAMFQDFIPRQLATLKDYATLIPGTVEAIAACRTRGLKIGSTTGYNGDMLALLRQEAKKQGYEPDASFCSTDVPVARPAPWMAILNAMELQIYPFEAIVKVGDTIPDIEEGLNAGMWTIGLAKTGNEIGLNEAQINDLPPDVLENKLNRAYKRMYHAGAHYVVDGIWDIPPILDQINERLAHGERP